ncbi:uncharacterized protein JKF63_07950 [Porcisia hertigi]|uniref:Uncharacterized protein n=1 Tax=Porcisia hertigi TaxID=2761500 RepID=A0A836HQ65_9TRYP|nr:hypothetical protein JKF63_07950 [Porcisia hertigi]
MDSHKHRAPPLLMVPSSSSHTHSKTTVTSANAASNFDKGPLLTPSVSNTNERYLLQGAGTPIRHASMLENQQLTPSGSLQWPSTHRSVSSAAATRDSSRHSQIADRMNATGVGMSAALCVRDRARSSASETPRSSHDGHNEYRPSTHTGVDSRPGYAPGPQLRTPRLVEDGDSLSFSQHSAAHSVSTTALCTPRDGTIALLRGSAEPPSTANETKSGATPIPPTVHDFEAEAHQLTREQLEEQVEHMRATNVVLQTSVLRLRESLATLQEGMRANYADLERRHESIVSTLLRRLEATKRRRSKLVSHLCTVEAEKASQDAKLRNTTQSINELSKHLRHEEQEIANRLQRRLERLHAQRVQLDHALEEQTSSLQQLEQLVQEVEEMDQSDSADTGTGCLGAQVADLTPPPLTAPGGNAAPAVVHERSSSRMSVASSTNAATTADVAYDPTAMIRYLEEEIVAAEGLRAEALSKAEKYVATRVRLERRLAREKQQRIEQQLRTQALRQQLQDTSTAANEAAAAQAIAMEMEVERHLNSARLGGDLISGTSSTCATPMVRAVSTMASRGNSGSPAANRLCSGPALQDLESRSQDSFMLPMSSVSSVPAAARSRPDHVGSGRSVSSCLARCTSPSDAQAGAAVMGTPSRFSSLIPSNAPGSRDETTISSEGTPRARLLVQNTSRMAAPRPVTPAEGTPLCATSMNTAQETL